MKTKLTLFVAAIAVALFGMGCASVFSPASITVTPLDSNVVTDIGILKKGIKLANNRDYYFTKIPKELEGLHFVRMEVRKNGQYHYDASAKCRAYVFVENYPAAQPEIARNELVSKGWKETNYTLEYSEEVLFLVFEKVIPKGTYLMKSQGSWPYMLGSRSPITVKD